MEKDSIERLNNFKIETNKLSVDIEDKTYYLNQIKSKYIDVKDISRAYKNKIHEISTVLEEQGIDFWNNDFELREAIIDYLNTELYYGAVMLCYIDIKILDSKLKNLAGRRISLTKTKKVLLETEKINKTYQNIKTYNLNKDLEDTLIKHFIIVSDEDEMINLNESYEKMKKNIKEIGLDQVSLETDDFIKKIIQEKTNFAKEKQEKSRQRTR